MSPKKGPATPRASSKKKASSSTASHRSGPWVIGAHDAKSAPAIEETLLDPLPPASVSGPDIKKNGISKKPARRLDEHRDDHHPGWTALSPDKRTKLGETDVYLPQGITEGMLMEDAQACEGDVLVPEIAAAAAVPHNVLLVTAAAPSSTPLLPPFPVVESDSSTTGNSPLTPLNEDLDDDSGSSSWTRKPPRLDECEDEGDASATKKDWNGYVFKKQAERVKRVIPNPDLEDAEPFVNTFVPVTPPLAAAAAAAPAETVDMEAELEEMDLEQPPPAAAPESPGLAHPQGDAPPDPDPNRRQENDKLSPAPDTPDDDNLLLLDNRVLKNNILKAMDVRQDRMEALFNRVANQMVTNQDFTTNSIIGIETEITSLSTTANKLTTGMKKNAKDQNAKADRIDAELHNLKNSLEKRIAALETAPRGSPQRSASGSDPVAPATADPWSGYIFKGLEKQALAPATSAARSGGPDRDFQPSCVILKGWRRCNENRSLSTNDAIVLGEKARALIPKEISDLIDSVDANYMQKRRIILRIRQGDTRREDCWKVRTALTKALRESPLRVNGRDVYAIVGPTPSNRERNRSIGKALSILEEMIPATQRAMIVLDFRAGIAYFSEDGVNSDVSRYVTLGRTDSKQG